MTQNKPNENKAEMAEFLRVFYDETTRSESPYTAYLNAESWHTEKYQQRRFKSYNVFKVMKSRHMRTMRGRNVSRSMPLKNRRNEFVSRIIDLLPENLRDEMRDKWASIR
mgnify:CR=1 FL=1